MPYIHSVQCSLGEHYYDQETLSQALLADWSERYFNPQRILDFQKNVLVGGRHLAIPLEKYNELKGFGDFNNAWLDAAVPMASKAVSGLLEGSGLVAEDISAITSTTVAGLAVPSLDARLMNKLPFKRNTKEASPSLDWVVGGRCRINRVGDYLKGHPTEAAILISVDCVRWTLQKQDLSVANIIASGLFGDGCAAVLMVGDEHPLAESTLRWSNPFGFFADTERIMGWDVVDTGFKVVLSPEVPKLVAAELPGEVDALLDEAGLDEHGIDFMVARPEAQKS